MNIHNTTIGATDKCANTNDLCASVPISVLAIGGGIFAGSRPAKAESAGKVSAALVMAEFVADEEVMDWVAEKMGAERVVWAAVQERIIMLEVTPIIWMPWPTMASSMGPSRLPVTRYEFSHRAQACDSQ